MAKAPDFKCPKCSRVLKCVGEVMIDKKTSYPAYQCNECLVQTEMYGEKVEVALSFYVKNGQAFDGQTDQPLTFSK